MLEAYKNKKVFITGHTGFKGSWLTRLLEVLGSRIGGLALAPGTNPAHFHLLNSDCKSIISDISNAGTLKAAIRDFEPEILFHLAAQPLVRASYKDPVNTYQTNVLGTLNVLEAVRETPSIKGVVIVTTDKVYENKEWTYPYREIDELGGYDMYSSSKACTEILVRSYQRSFFNLSEYKKSHNILVATARAGNVIGGGDWSEDRLIPDIMRATSNQQIAQIRNPNAVRPWQHVLDCLYGYLLLGEKLLHEEKTFVGAWNFAPHSSESMPVKDVAAIAKESWADINVSIFKSDQNVHEAQILKLDNTKAITELEWQPYWNTREAIIKTIEWYKSFYVDNNILTTKQIEDYLKRG